MFRASVLAALWVTLVPHAAHAVRVKRNELMHVLWPVPRGNVPAHPFVNVIVSLDPAANPKTFRARMGGADITDRFKHVTRDGKSVLQARVDPPLVRTGKRRSNRLRVEVRSVKQSGKGPRIVRDVDRVRFRAYEAPNQPPTVSLPVAEVFAPGIPFTFQPTVSDPEQDALDYHWDFGDGSDPSTEPVPTHVFLTETTLTSQVTVSDGQVTVADSEKLLPCPDPDPGRTRGMLRIESTSRLELGVVPLGGTASQTMTVKNYVQTTVSNAIDPTHIAVASSAGMNVGDRILVENFPAASGGDITIAGLAGNTIILGTELGTIANIAGAIVRVSPPTSQLRVHLDLEGTGYSITPSDFDLGPVENQDVTVTFTASTPGHQSVEIVALASASNSCVAHVLAHAFAGDAPGTGPTLAADPVFYLDSPPTVLGTGTFAIFPNGARAYIDSTIHLCQSPANGPGTGDFCLTDADCIGGGTCLQSSNCIGGDRAGQPCTKFTDCPRGSCPSLTDFGSELIAMCGDGQGNLFLLSDEGTYTDTTTDDTELDQTLLRISFDDNGNRTDARIISRVTAQTAQLACDRLPASGGGRVYEAEFHNAPPTCDRDGRESLTALRKTNGVSSVLVPRIDAVEGLDMCKDSLDESGALQVSDDGSSAFASLSIGGLYRILPTPLPISPDVGDYFELAPDGALVVVRASDRGPIGQIRVYKIFPTQALGGVVHLDDLTPCATVPVPNNGGSTIIDYPFAVGRAATGGDDDLILVSFTTTGGTVRNPIFSSTLRVQGTIALFSPAGSSSCNVQTNPPTYVNLDLLDLLTF